MMPKCTGTSSKRNIVILFKACSTYCIFFNFRLIINLIILIVEYDLNIWLTFKFIYYVTSLIMIKQQHILHMITNAQCFINDVYLR